MPGVRVDTNSLSQVRNWHHAPISPHAARNLDILLRHHAIWAARQNPELATLWRSDDHSRGVAPLGEWCVCEGAPRSCLRALRGRGFERDCPQTRASPCPAPCMPGNFANACCPCVRRVVPLPSPQPLPSPHRRPRRRPRCRGGGGMCRVGCMRGGPGCSTCAP